MQASTFFPKVRRMLLYCSPLIFNTLLASFPAASRAPCSCHSVSSWERSSNFGALGLRRWGSPGQRIPCDGFWSRRLAWRTTVFCELNTLDWFPYVWALPQNQWRLRRHHILKYATQLSCSGLVENNGSHRSIVWLLLFQHSHCTFVTILLKPFC